MNNLNPSNQTMPMAESYLSLLKAALTASLYEESAYSIIEGCSREGIGKLSGYKKLVTFLKTSVVKAFKRKNVLLIRTHQYNESIRSKGLDWPMFGFTMIGHKRLDNIRFAIETILAEKIPGDFVETGVWRGGALIWMRAVLKVHDVKDRHVWGADSFEGLPAKEHAEDLKSSDNDLSGLNFLAVSLEQVKRNIEKFEPLDERVHFLKGWFKDTLPQAPIKNIAILRLDGDMYESTMDALVNLYHKVTDGGFVIIDDYNGWEGCKRAIHDFFAKNKINVKLEDIDGTAVYFRKPKL